MRPPRVKMKLSPPLAAVTALLIAVAMTESAADPGEAAPFLVLPLMNGLEYKRTPGRTMLLFAYSEDDLYHQHMLTDSWSLETFLKLAPFDAVDYVFVPSTEDAAKAEQLARRVHTNITQALNSLRLPVGLHHARYDQMFFSVAPISVTAPWVSDTLSQWGGQRKVLRVLGIDGQPWNRTVPRLDAWYDWLPPPPPAPEPSATQPSALHLTYVATPCSPLPPKVAARVKGGVVVAPKSPFCTTIELLVRLQQAGAVAAVLHPMTEEVGVQLLMSPDQDLDLGQAPWAHPPQLKRQGGQGSDAEWQALVQQLLQHLDRGTKGGDASSVEAFATALKQHLSEASDSDESGATAPDSAAAHVAGALKRMAASNLAAEDMQPASAATNNAGDTVTLLIKVLQSLTGASQQQPSSLTSASASTVITTTTTTIISTGSSAYAATSTPTSTPTPTSASGPSQKPRADLTSLLAVLQQAATGAAAGSAPITSTTTASSTTARLGAKGKGGAKKNGGGEDEDIPLNIAAAMIGYRDGIALRNAILSAEATQGSLAVEYHTLKAPGAFLGINATGHLIEAGWARVPTLMHMAWQAQHQAYLSDLGAAVQELQNGASVVLPLFKSATLEGEHGSSVEVQMPDEATLRALTEGFLLMELGCEGTRDDHCPQWDHVVQLFACCDAAPKHSPASCRACDITPWAQLGRAPGPGAPSASVPSPGSNTTSTKRGAQCGVELGRWVTPFRRRTGRWLNSITPLLPLLQSGKCTFTVQAPPWAGAWAATVTLIASSDRPPQLPPRDAAGFGILTPCEREQELVGQLSLKRAPGKTMTGGAKSSDTAGIASDIRTTSIAVAPGPALTGGVRGGDTSSGSDGHAGKGKGAAATVAGVLHHQAGGTAVHRKLRGLQQQQQATMASSSTSTSVPVSTAVGLPEEDVWHALVPLATIPLFEGGTFDGTYNDRAVVEVTTPRTATRAVITAVISGHGSDNDNCAEFCPTSHHFNITAPGRQPVERGVVFDTAGTAWGCTHAVRAGAVPNEHRTWLHGRNGWCNGAPVSPWQADISGVVAAPTYNTTFSYRGLFKGANPNPEGEPGYILMTSFITFFGPRPPPSY